MSESTLHAITSMLAEVLGDEMIDGPVTLETSFADDLELESLELVQLAELVQRHWGAKVDFNAWIAGKSIDEIISLKVGDLVAYVDDCL